MALLGANGAGKTTTLKAISNLLHSERGEVTKGAIVFDGTEVQSLSPNEVVRRGCIQVMQGRYCFGHLSVEENLLTGAFTRRDGAAAIRADLEKVYAYFPRLRERRQAMAGYTSGGEQQMCAIGRALMSRPKMILLDEPSMGLAPQIVEEIFTIMKNLNDSEGVSFLLAEQNANLALKFSGYGYILENGRVVLDGTATALAPPPPLRRMAWRLLAAGVRVRAVASPPAGGGGRPRDLRGTDQTARPRPPGEPPTAPARRRTCARADRPGDHRPRLE